MSKRQGGYNSNAPAQIKCICWYKPEICPICNPGVIERRIMAESLRILESMANDIPPVDQADQFLMAKVGLGGDRRTSKRTPKRDVMP